MLGPGVRTISRAASAKIWRSSLLGMVPPGEDALLDQLPRHGELRSIAVLDRQRGHREAVVARDEVDHAMKTRRDDDLTAREHDVQIVSGCHAVEHDTAALPDQRRALELVLLLHDEVVVERPL